jgi:hypothetical protein
LPETEDGASGKTGYRCAKDDGVALAYQLVGELLMQVCAGFFELESTGRISLQVLYKAFSDCGDDRRTGFPIACRRKNFLDRGVVADSRRARRCRSSGRRCSGLQTAPIRALSRDLPGANPALISAERRRSVPNRG